MKTKVRKVNRKRPERGILEEAAEIIREGGLVAFPTETVYGLGADYMNKKAVEKLYKVKKRPENKPFTVHISDIKELQNLACEMTLFSKALLERFWPGPLTVIFNTKSGEKIGTRMPSNRIALDFISACDTSIVAPSANMSGNQPPCRAEDVLKDLDGKIDFLLDGGETEMGIESTVIDTSAFPFRMLRKGAISKSRIADLGRELVQSLSLL